MKMTRILPLAIIFAFIAVEAYLLQPTTYRDVEEQKLQMETTKKKADIDYKKTKAQQEARKRQADLDRKKAEVDLQRKEERMKRGYYY